MILFGILLLVAAAVVGAVGVATNLGGADALAGSFSVFGVDVAGPSGWLFLYGIVVGGVGMFGVGILYDDVFRRFEKWRELRETRREADELRERNDMLADQLDVERAEHVAAHAPAAGGTAGDAEAGKGSAGRRRTWRFRRVSRVRTP
jgi:hypothetical protein